MSPAEAPTRSATGAAATRKPAARRTIVIRGQVAPPPGVGQAAPPAGSDAFAGHSHAGRHIAARSSRNDRVARAHAPRARRRPPRPASERIVGARPDRAALWAVLMGVFLIAVAVLSASGA